MFAISRLRRAAVLRRPAGAAAVREEPGLAAGVEDGARRSCRPRPRTYTHILMHRPRRSTGNWDEVWDVSVHLILPAGDARPAGHRASSSASCASTSSRRSAATTSRPRAPAACPERRVVSRHAFRNALVPVVTVHGPAGRRCCWAARCLTETTFSWPGLGSRLLQYLNEPRLHRRAGPDHRSSRWSSS